MNKITQHIPNFVDTTEFPLVDEFETVEELKEIPWVKDWLSDGTLAMSGKHLIVENEVGDWWWVVGYIENPADIDLPLAKFVTLPYIDNTWTEEQRKEFREGVEHLKNRGKIRKVDFEALRKVFEANR